MAMRRDSSANQEVTPARRMRLVPPRVGEVEQRTRKDREAQRFSEGLRGEKRRRLAMLVGNALVLLTLVGLPLLRGHNRALSTQRAYMRFARCIYGVELSGGLGAMADEGEYFAAQLARADRGWLPRCTQQLGKVPTREATFVLPGVKAAEARVREAVAMLRGELAGLSSFVPGMRMPERSVRALRLLRGTVRTQVQQAGFSDREAELPLRAAHVAAMAAPARLPLYAAADATLSVWGDDHTLRVVGMDGNGVAFLELDPGKPFTRARAVRPRSLRGYVRLDERGWLLWATAPSRCGQRSEGCFGKTARVAAVPDALLDLPASRALAAHPAGRLDRSLVSSDERLILAALTADNRSLVQEFALPTGLSVGAEVPPLTPLRSWPVAVDDAVLLSVGGEALAFGVHRQATSSTLVALDAVSAESLSSLAPGSAWLTGCAAESTAGVAFGNGRELVVAERTRRVGAWESKVWDALPAVVKDAVSTEMPSADRVQRICSPKAALVALLEADDQLSLVVCRHASPRCTRVPVAASVRRFSVLPTARGALIAYAGEERAQIRTRTFDLDSGRLGPELLPAACWGKSGFCSRPTLARLGRRIVLVAPEKTDLLALESSDEGQHWSAPPVL